MGLERVSVDYVVVDTLRVPRAVFASIWEAWRDGYSEMVAGLLGIGIEEAVERWDDQIAAIRDAGSYAAWLVPVVAGVVPRQRAARSRSTVPSSQKVFMSPFPFTVTTPRSSST